MNVMSSDDQSALQAAERKFVEKESPKHAAAGGPETEFLIGPPCEISDAASEPAWFMYDLGGRLAAGDGFMLEHHRRRYCRDLHQLLFVPLTSTINRSFVTHEGCDLAKSC